MSGLLYCNDGAWVENCTALVENRAGELRLQRLTESTRELLDAPLCVRKAA